MIQQDSIFEGWFGFILDIQRSHIQNWNICWDRGISIRTDVWPIRTVASSKYVPKINIGCVGRKNATEDLGSLFKFYCQSSSECYEDTRRKEKKSKPLLLVSTSSSIFQRIDHSAFTTIGPFLKHQFSNLALLVHEPLLKSSFISPTWEVSPNHVQ